MASPALILGFIICLAIVALLSQQRLMTTQQTLRERLQQLPDQVSLVVSAIQPEAATAAPGVAAARHFTTSATTHVSLVPPPPPSLPHLPPSLSPPPKAGCPGRRRPYHVLLTAASGVYQQWQTRIAYHHYRKLKASHPCSDIGNFTRLLNTPQRKPDGLMGEIPTVLVSQLDGGRCDTCDHGFIVMNRPWGLRQFTRLREFADIREDYIFIVETDHLLLRPLPNEATETRPVGFGFYYMTYKYDPPKLKPVIAKYHDPEGVDPVGPSPVIMHKQQLVAVVEPWWQLCITLKRDPQADSAFGWVLEMWGWAIATARLGIRHEIQTKLQAEPGGPGIARLSDFFIYHYTFDLEVKAGWGRTAASTWAWSKRRFMSRYPERLTPAPSGAQRSTETFVEMMNEAIEAERTGRLGWKEVRVRSSA